MEFDHLVDCLFDSLSLEGVSLKSGLFRIEEHSCGVATHLQCTGPRNVPLVCNKMLNYKDVPAGVNMHASISECYEQ